MGNKSKTTLSLLNEDSYIKCPCKSCGNSIEFPSHGVGEEIDCPHCGKKTTLFAPPKRKKTSRRKIDSSENPPIIEPSNELTELEFTLRYWKHAICPKCAATFEYMGAHAPTFWDCETCGTKVELNNGKLPKDLPEMRSLCPQCRALISRSMNSCPHCHTRFMPRECQYCGCTEFDIVTPSKPFLFAPLSLAGILISAASSAIGDAIFHDEYRCARCGRKPD